MSLFKRFKKEEELKEVEKVEKLDTGSIKYPDHVVTMNSYNFEEFIEKYQFVVVDFYSNVCIPCKVIAPRVRKISKDYKGKVAFGKINVNEHQDIAQKFKVSGVPTLIFFRDGKRVGSMVGVKSIKKIKDEIEKIL